MIDIFDIISDRKDIHINIEGEVSSDGYLFNVDQINEISDLLLSNQKDVEFKIFNVKEYRDSEPLRIDRFGGMYSSAYTYERAISCVEFQIDVHITNRLYNKFDGPIRDFIDYFTRGAIVCTTAGMGDFTLDSHEEYMSRPSDEVSITTSLLDYMYSWEEDNNEWSGIGSYPLRDRINRTHDADGDTAVFASRLMGIPNGMAVEYDPGDIIGRPVRGGSF